ncbi:hypothetical protein BT69DRAFT_36429 [Atractiella rhizophila]|nr:hypothetical protein BT69DRAFT_36429 [Atractiella rhizophila]
MAFKLKSCSYLDNGQYKFVSLQGQKLEWNGKKFSRTWHEVRLLKWKGLRKISSLMAFPMTDELKKELTERGRLYAKLAGTPKYLHYTGVLSRVEGHGMERRIIKLRAEGRIVVDVKSYRRMNPTKDIWSRSWYARSRSGPGGKSSSRRKISDDEDAGENSLLGSNIADEDLCLTPPTIYAFSLVLKDWGEIKVDEVKEIVFDEDAYEHLVLDEDHKDMIKCLVDATAGENKTNKIVTDVISGKGGGAIVVLHGNPGTGKTLTAEAVAEHLKRPLYSVGAGELGVHAEVLERRLRDTLEVAKTWGAVLLIDEADVFLEERSLRDVSRNAMLKYPNLDKEKRKMIWIKFLELSGFKIDLSIQSPTKLKLPAQKALPPTLLTPPDSPPASPKPSAPTVQVVTAGDLDRLASKIFNGRSIKNSTSPSLLLSYTSKRESLIYFILQSLGRHKRLLYLRRNRRA